VAVAMLAEGAIVRHGQDPDGPRLRFATAEWDAFVDGSKNNESDREESLFAWPRYSKPCRTDGVVTAREAASVSPFWACFAAPLSS
jgi:hypothetical protein